MSLNQFNIYKKIFNKKLVNIIDEYVEIDIMKERITISRIEAEDCP